MTKAMKEKENLRSFRQRVSNVPARRKLAYRVEARNFAMRFVREVLDLNGTSVEQLALDAAVNPDELVGVLTRDPSRFPSRDLLFSVREASRADLPPKVLELMNKALGFIDVCNRISALERATKPNTRRLWPDELPALPYSSMAGDGN